MIKFLMNLLFPSRFTFEDGSRVDYLIREDLLQYSSVHPLKDVVDIPLIYDEKTNKSRINQTVIWKWQSSDRALTINERRDIAQKINVFLKRRPREFEPFTDVN